MRVLLGERPAGLALPMDALCAIPPKTASEAVGSDVWASGWIGQTRNFQVTTKGFPLVWYGFPGDLGWRGP
jgi:hypothetical protein